MDEKKLIDDHLIEEGRFSKNYGQQSYLLVLIAVSLWILTSFTVGVQGFLPWEFPTSKILSMIMSFLVLCISILAVSKAKKSKKGNEKMTKQNKIGSFGSYILIVVFGLVTFNNLADIYIYFFR